MLDQQIKYRQIARSVQRAAALLREVNVMKKEAAARAAAKRATAADLPHW